MIVDDSELEDMLFYAFRYALGRNSYATSDVADMLITHKRVIGKRTREVIINDIKDTLMLVDAGHSVDVTDWMRVLEVLE